jgi:membrane fusion protein, multidrug efflux system
MNRTLRLLAPALLAGAPLLSSAATPTAPAPAAKVRLVAAAAGPSGGAAGAWAPASVVAVERATLSTRVAATVSAVNFREGQQVKKGQVVLALADPDLRGAVSAAETGLAAAMAQEQRIRTLLAQRAATQAELDQATAQRAQAEAGATAARTNLGYAQLRAPFTGTVRARKVEPGDLVGPGQPLMDLEGEALELSASLSEAEARGLALGQSVPFEAEGARGTATITALTPGGDPVTHRRTVRARVARAEGALQAGAFARLQLPGVARQAASSDQAGARVWVPRSALVERGDLTGVFVAAGGRAELRWIALGDPVGDGVAVRAGLKQGEQIVDAPGALRDGQAVEVQP